MSAFTTKPVAARQALYLMDLHDHQPEHLPPGWDQTVRVAVIAAIHGCEDGSTMRFANCVKYLLEIVAKGEDK